MLFDGQMSVVNMPIVKAFKRDKDVDLRLGSDLIKCYSNMSVHCIFLYQLFSVDFITHKGKEHEIEDSQLRSYHKYVVQVVCVPGREIKDISVILL